MNQHVIRSNSKQNKKDPVLTVKTSKANSPDKPLSCGAKVWIETHGTVTLDQKTIIR